MEMAFIQPIRERLDMTTTKEEIKKKTLTAHDRCDRCGAQAYVKVSGVSGDLMFCSHHFTKIMSDPNGKEAMEKFAYEILDERDFVYDQ